MSEYQWPRDQFYRLRCEKAARSLQERGFSTIVAEDREDAAEQILAAIGAKDRVGIPGTVTVRELDLVRRLSARGNEVIEHWLPDASAEEVRRQRLGQLTSDVLLTSTNALTLEGELVNIDGTGNRVAAMVFGPQRVIVVAGANKIAHDIPEALERSKRIAGPINAMRLGLDKPCAKAGYCVECAPSTTICAITVIMERAPSDTDMLVVLVPEDLGY